MAGNSIVLSMTEEEMRESAVEAIRQLCMDGKWRDVLKEIALVEKSIDDPEQEDMYDKKYGWDTTGKSDYAGKYYRFRKLSGGHVPTLMKNNLIKKGYYSNQYHHYYWNRDLIPIDTLIEILESTEKREMMIEQEARPEEIPAISDEEIVDYQRMIDDGTNMLDYWGNYVAPNVVGCERAKKAILLMLASPDDKHRPKTRGRIHVLLYGDPGTGKTLLRQFLTHDIGTEFCGPRSTGAGLTMNLRTGELGAMPRAHLNPWQTLCLEELGDFKELEQLKETQSEGEFKVESADFSRMLKAEIRVLGVTNEINFSEALQDRYDIQIEFKKPLRKEADPVVDKLVDNFMTDELEKDPDDLKKYLKWVKEYDVNCDQSTKDKMKKVLKAYLDLKIPEHERDSKRVDMRRIDTALRLMFSVARLHRRDVMVKDVIPALQILDPDFNGINKRGLESIIEEMR